MKRIILSISAYFFLCIPGLRAQNLPSLVTGKNINATFSILAYDREAGEWGIAVATNNIYVGNSTVYIEPGLGAFSVIAETEPAYARDGFAQLRQGKSIREAIEYTALKDPEVGLRQVSGIDSLGRVYAFTGASWKYQRGFAGAIQGKGYVVMGNQLGDSVLQHMSAGFEKAGGSLAQRLMAALVAGERAGGQVTGKQSAALTVKGIRNEWFNNIDLRVDDSKDPFGDLQRLLNYHYGRIRLNQAIMAIRKGNLVKGKELLSKGEGLVKGWNGIQSKVILAYLLLHEEDRAVDLVRAALAENPKWKENLPAFYLLKDRAGMEGLIDEGRFGEKDWIAALSMTAQVNGDGQMGLLCRKALQGYPGSSYLHYLSGKSMVVAGRVDEARRELQEALRLDAGNGEAEELLRVLVR